MTRVDAKELLDRAVAKLTSDIEKAGGVENMTPEDMPEVHIRGDINTPYRCIGGAVYTMQRAGFAKVGFISEPEPGRSEEQTSELQSLMRISYTVFCLKRKSISKTLSHYIHINR